MILLVDGQNLAFAMNMTRELSTSDGTPTHAVLGFLRTLGNVRREFGASDVYVAWDGGRSKQRIELYPDYKANRDAKKQDPEWLRRREALDVQIGLIRSLLLDLGANQIWGEGIEGDDIIAVIVANEQLRFRNRLIVSADKDFWQLVGSGVAVFNPINNKSPHKFVEQSNFEKITGLLPVQYLDFKAMVGDKSDGIPGCQGVGEKTALKIIKQFGSYDNFILAVRNGSYAPTKLENRAVKDEHGFTISKKLMDLKNPMYGEVGAIECHPGKIDVEAFKSKMKALEMRDETTGGIISSFELKLNQ